MGTTERRWDAARAPALRERCGFDPPAPASLAPDQLVLLLLCLRLLPGLWVAVTLSHVDSVSQLGLSRLLEDRSTCQLAQSLAAAQPGDAGDSSEAATVPLSKGTSTRSGFERPCASVPAEPSHGLGNLAVRLSLGPDVL